jgi:hypothetical protein
MSKMQIVFHTFPIHPVVNVPQIGDKKGLSFRAIPALIEYNLP